MYIVCAAENSLVSFAKETAKIKRIVRCGNVTEIKHVSCNYALFTVYADYKLVIGVCDIVSVIKSDNSKRRAHLGNRVVVVAYNEVSCYCINAGSCKAVLAISHGDTCRQISRDFNTVRIAVIFNRLIIKGNSAHINGCFFNSPAEIKRQLALKLEIIVI